MFEVSRETWEKKYKKNLIGILHFFILVDNLVKKNRYVFIYLILYVSVIWLLYGRCKHFKNEHIFHKLSYCEFVTFPLLSWVKCGTWL